MKLLFKQRIFSWFDSYDIYDETGNTIFVVKGELAWGHCLRIYDSSGNFLGTVKERVFTFMPKFEIYLGNQYVGEIRKEFTLFFPKYILDCNGWEVNGDIFQWDYTVTDRNGTVVMSVDKKLFHMSDTYAIDIARREDSLTAIMIVLAIDAANCGK